MSKLPIWKLRPYIHFYIYHEDLKTFVKPITNTPYWTLMIIESGSFRYEFGNNHGKVSGESLFFCPPYFKLKRKIISPMTFFYMRLEFLQPSELFANFYCGTDALPEGVIRLGNTKRLQTNMAYTRMLATRNTDFSKQWMNHIVSEILFMYYAEKHDMEIPYVMSSRDKEMNRAVELIKEHAYDSFSIKWVSNEIGLSPVQFTRRFKSAFNIKPFDYLTSLRIQRIQRLLVETDYTLSEIAKRSGFQNEYYLSRFFKKATGTNPSYYKKKYKL